MTRSRAETLHALYRFFDPEGELLYVGITHDPGHRWASHRDDKPWWTTVARIEIEAHPSRAAVLAAEKAAIIAEKPRYNVQHQGGTPTPPAPPARVLPPRVSPVQVRDWAALALSTGRCPVGRVEATDETWVSLRLKSYAHGGLMDQVVVVRWSQVEQVAVAYAEDFEPDGHGGFIVDDDHLAALQDRWHDEHPRRR